MNVGNDRAVDHSDAERHPAPPAAEPAEVAELHRLGLVPEPPGPDHDIRHDHVLKPDDHFTPGPQHSHPVTRDVL